MNKKKTRVQVINQGCRLNQAETASIQTELLQSGYTQTNRTKDANIIIINTCTVTNNADLDTKKLTRKISNENPNSKIALVGCQAQIHQEKLLTLPNVNWVIGNQEKDNIIQTIEKTNKKILTPKIKSEPFVLKTPAIDVNHTRANLKIQDGCDFFCAFCIIPFARGKARSRVFEDIIKEAIILGEHGFQELILTGINIGTYQYKNKTLTDVIKSLSEITAIKRIRISSIEPTTIEKNLIQEIKTNPKCCHYLHIPIQSGSDHILTQMNRHYSIKEYTEFINYCRKELPNACIGTDIIVGFPGETKAEFDKTTLNLLTLPIDYFHVFSYSERKLARSKKMENQVPQNIIAKRSKILRTISQTKKKKFMSKFINQTMSVLIENKKNGYWHGFTENYIKVKVKANTKKNSLIKTKLITIENQQMIGEKV